MASKRFTFLFIGMLLCLSVNTFAQDSGVYDIYDSSVIHAKGRAQHTQFMNNSYNYPAKPRSMWELGVSGGLFALSSDVSADVPTFGFGAHVRKSLGYLFSLRMQYNYGIAKGLNWKPSENFMSNSAWTSNGYGAGEVVYYNYKSTIQDISLQGLFTFNNVRFHKQKTKMNIYLGAGVGATIYDTRVNALNGDTKYDFSSISAGGYSSRKDIRKELKDMMDNSYETPAQTDGPNRSKLFGQTFRPSAHIITGMAFKLSKRVNLAIENKFSLLKDDLLDGQRYQDGAPAVLTSNFDAYNYTSIGLNFNIGKNAVEPLYWVNPLEYAYSELNNPRHMKLPKPEFDDEDGDGVVDQLDRCPGTPAGVKVDTHGCPLDTDGDGVPDYLDKELITPTACQPVDADGVGKCPEPDCCKDRVAAACDMGDLPSISFRNGNATLSNDGKAMLATVAAKLKNNANCTIAITGYPVASKASQSLCNRRLNAIKAHLTEVEGIAADRIITNCQVGGGDINTIDISSK